MVSESPAPLFLITHEFYPRRGGIATFSEEMAKASQSLGFDVEVWAQKAHTHTEKKWSFKIKRLPLKGTHDLLCQLRLMKELIVHRRRLRHATVYLPEPGPMLAMMLLQYCPGFRPKRIVLTFHGSEILRFHKNPLNRFLTRKLIKHASRISTLSHYTEKLLYEHFPEAHGKVFRTPGALRSDFAIVHRQTSQHNDRLVILTVGRLHPRKGQLLTIQALQALPNELKERVEYWIVGTQNKGTYEQQLRSAASEDALKVRFFGDVTDDELDTLYDRAGIFAMTSINHGESIEGFGLVYLEAAAHGIPVVGHAVGGVGEAVQHGVTGFLVPPEKPEELTEAFRILIADKPLRTQMGNAGRAWALKHHWSHSAEALFGQNLPRHQPPPHPSNKPLHA